jgi:hypothetical protein
MTDNALHNKDGYGAWEITAGITSAEYVSHLLLKKCPKLVEKCGFDTLANTTRTAVVFSGIITTGLGVAFCVHRLRSRYYSGEQGISQR